MNWEGKMNDWINKRTFHHSQFEDKRKLVELKEKLDLKISLAFPTLNEEKTIGKEIMVIKTELMDRFPLIDEIAVIDSNSIDKTREIAEEFGAKVFLSESILPNYGSYKGKGENLWKSLYVLEGDIIVWIDADIQNIHPKFVYGLLGPLLYYPDEIKYVKGFYERPIQMGDGIKPSGGGRVTEILIRPLFSLFYPELSGLIQPLSGEYAGCREILERLPFSVGYGVETGHLLDILNEYGIDVLAQVDLDKRIHRNQTIQALSRMSFGILLTFMKRLEAHKKVKLLTELEKYYKSISVEKDKHYINETEIIFVERPPMIEIPEYKKKYKK